MEESKDLPEIHQIDFPEQDLIEKYFQALDFGKKRVLVIGGNDFLSRLFITTLLKHYPTIRDLLVYTPQEDNCFELGLEFPDKTFPNFLPLLGDIRDKQGLTKICQDHGVDIILNFGLLGKTSLGETNPLQYLQNNVSGTENIIYAALNSSVKKVLSFSTDESTVPTNLCGATRSCSDKLFISANHIRGQKKTRFSVFKLGRSLGYLKTMVDSYQKLKSKGVLPITSEATTGFALNPEKAVMIALCCVDRMWGGETFVPKSSSYRIMELANLMSHGCRLVVVGNFYGDKAKEILIHESDAARTIEFDGYYVVCPPSPEWKLSDLAHYYHGKIMEGGFHYSSENNDMISSKSFKKLLDKYYLKTSSEFEHSL